MNTLYIRMFCVRFVYVCPTHKIDLIKYCVFFENFKIYSGLWPLSVFQRCVYTDH